MSHTPKKVFENKSAIVYDDFLPEDIYEQVRNYSLVADYEYINTGKTNRAWHIHDGFPLRSALNSFYHADQANKPQGPTSYPTNTKFDLFTDTLNAMHPKVEHLCGKPGEWEFFSVTSWIYPHGTGLSLHDDGAGVYTGAYVYFINPVWRPHWGGQLLIVEEEGNNKIIAARESQDKVDYWKRKWLHVNGIEDQVMDHGFAHCIFPKRNRIVYIAPDVFHMVTRVNEQCGDNLRMSLAGFFHRPRP